MDYTAGQMSRYVYDKLTVACLEPKHHRPHEIREAVEYLKTIDQTRFTGLRAEVDTRAGPYLLRAIVLIPLSDIIGKTPKQAWEIFASGADEQRESLWKSTWQPQIQKQIA